MYDHILRTNILYLSSQLRIYTEGKLCVVKSIQKLILRKTTSQKNLHEHILWQVIKLMQVEN